jgi:hypothetical protein
VGIFWSGTQFFATNTRLYVCTIVIQGRSEVMMAAMSFMTKLCCHNNVGVQEEKRRVN